jgi:type IV pilus assembly protein PilB
MKIPVEKIKEIFISEGFINEKDFNDIVADSERMGQDVLDVLVSKGIVSQDYLDTLLASYFGVEKINLNASQINKDILNLLPEEIAKQKKVIIFQKEPGDIIDAAMADPGDLATIEFLEQYLKTKIKPFLATEGDLNTGFAMYGKAMSQDFRQIIEDNIKKSMRSGKRGEEAAADVPIVAIVDNLISYALSSRASDIHFEIFQDGIFIRYRIDGVLHEIMEIPKEVHAAIVARVKLLAGLKIDEHYKPQDGRFRYKIGENEVLDVRVSILPTYYGEKVEMRLLSAAQRPLSLKELGLMDDSIEIVMSNIKKSYGLILVCGPTGSGKTTTLYSILGLLNNPQVNIVTIEDPIEYDIKFINQTQINPQAGVTFASGLRSILRQDPNIIMVGEIRDNETADISVQSALTGHLVLSSLHTNDAPTTIPRLLDMGIVSFLVSAVINMVLAQRLVRSICLECIYSIEPSPEIIKTIQTQLKELGISETYKIPKLIYAGKGCPSCGGTGYRGRVGIFEILNVTEDIRKIIISPDFSLDNLKKVARQEGMVSMFEDGLRKVERGITTVEELLRVIRE